MVLFAVALRAGYLAEIADVGFWSVPLGDAAIYAKRAAEIAAGDWKGPADFVHAPLYAYVMALPRIAGLTELAWVRVMQVGMSAASLVLLMGLTRRLIDRRSAIFAGLLYAVLPSAIYFDGLIEKSSLAVLLTMGMLAGAIKGQRANGQIANQSVPRAAVMSLAWWFVAGALLGLLVLTRQNALALVPVLMVMAVIGGGGASAAPKTAHSRSRLAWRASAAALVIVGFFAAVSPWMIRNKQVIGDFVVSTPNMGQNFWMGNDARSTGTYLSFARGKVNPEHEQAEWVKEAETATGRTMSAKEVSDWYFARGLKFIREQPIDWLKLTGKKLLMTIGAYELPDTEDYYLYARHSAMLRTFDAVLHFGVLVPLAAVGIVLTARDWRRLWPLYAYLLITILSVAAFVVFARYRFPLAPVLVMFAAAGISAVLPRGRGGESKGQIANRQMANEELQPAAGGRSRAIGAVVVVIGAVAASNARVYASRGVDAVAFSNHADALVNSGRVEDAIAEYRRSLVLDDADAETHAGMGGALARLNRFDEALPHFDRAARLAPGFARAHAGAGRALMFMGRPQDAERALREAARLDPDDLETMELLGWALGSTGKIAEATPLLEKALATGRAGAQTYLNLGNVRAMSGKFDDARRLFEQALEREPRNADALTSLAILSAQTNRWPDAAAWAKKALDVDGSREVLRQILDEAKSRGVPMGP